MPEGDSIFRATARLHRAFAGTELISADLRTPRLATAGPVLAGRLTLEVVPRGKHLLHRFAGGLTLHSHLRMDGSWRIGRAGGQRSPAAKRHTVRAVLCSAERTAIGDQLGMVHLIRTDAEDRVVGHLGPDLLDPEFDRRIAIDHLAMDHRTVGEALLDQRNLAGLGTIFTAEPLHRLQIHPWQRADSLPRQQLETLVDTARDILWRSAHHGRNRDRQLAPVGGPSPESAQSWVQDSVGLPCRRCGAPLRTASIGTAPKARMLAYCAPCQGGTAPTDPGGDRPARRSRLR